MENVIVVVVVESKKIRIMLLTGSSGNFSEQSFVVASFARCQGKSTECMFLWFWGIFVCVVFRFFFWFKSQLLTGRHCKV